MADLLPVLEDCYLLEIKSASSVVLRNSDAGEKSSSILEACASKLSVSLVKGLVYSICSLWNVNSGRYYSVS